MELNTGCVRPPLSGAPAKASDTSPRLPLLPPRQRNSAEFGSDLLLPHLILRVECGSFHQAVQVLPAGSVREDRSLLGWRRCVCCESVDSDDGGHVQSVSSLSLAFTSLTHAPEPA